MISARQLGILALLIGLSCPAGAAPQEPVGKRLAAIIGVAVEEYAKGVDESGRVKSVTELDEATGFIDEARNAALRLATPRAPEVRRSLDSLMASARRHDPPTALRRWYDVFSQALGSDGALDLPTRAIDLAHGRSIYNGRCAACHGVSGAGGAPASGGLAPPAIGHADVMRDVTPALTYRIVSVGVQGTAMPAWDSVLTSDERWDVVAFVNSLRATDQQRERGRSVLGRVCAQCPTLPAVKTFEWQAQRSDAELAAMLRAGDAVTGVPASAPLTASESDALVAALRADAVVAGVGLGRVAADARAGDPRAAAKTVLRTLDDAVSAYREGRTTAAADLAFDAYIAFEPLETNTRPRDPTLVARMERQFADFHTALKAGDLPQAETMLAALEQGMPGVLALALAESTPWSTFLESYLIILREGFEAILVLGAVVAFLLKTGHRERVRDIWIGSIAGVVASLILAVLLRTALAAVPASRDLIEGITMLVAVAVLFSVSYWLLSKVEAARWQQFIRSKVTSALQHGGSFTLAFVAFLAVFREGAETALFFQAIITRPDASWAPVVSGIAAGGVSLAVIFSLFYRFGIRIPLRPFFAVTSGVLYWMAFVFAGKGIAELQEAGAMTRTRLPSFPYIEALGIYPTVETTLVQVVLVGLLLFALWRTLLRPSVSASEAAAAAATSGQPDADAMPPEVAARINELQATARRLQQRVETLEREVEHDPATRPGGSA